MKKFIIFILVASFVTSVAADTDRRVTQISVNDRFSFMMFDRTFFYFDGYASGSSITILTNMMNETHRGQRIRSIFKTAQYDCIGRRIKQGVEILIDHNKRVIPEPPQSTGWSTVERGTVAWDEIAYICEGTSK